MRQRVLVPAQATKNKLIIELQLSLRDCHISSVDPLDQTQKETFAAHLGYRTSNCECSYICRLVREYIEKLASLTG